MPKRLPPLTITLPRDRASRGPDGHWEVTLTPQDMAQVPPEQLAAHYALADTEPEHAVEIVVNVLDSPVPKGEDLRLNFPRDTPLGVTAGFNDGRLVLRRPGPVTDDSFETTLPESLGVRPRPGMKDVNARTVKSVDRPGRDLAPTLSDQLLFEKRAFPGAVPRKRQEAVKQAHRSSRAFVFDRAASYRVGEICAYEPDLIADSQEFARCPYPRTWIELDAYALYDALVDAGQDVSIRPDQPLDERLGFLFTERGVYVAASHVQRDGSYTAGWSPVFYRWHQPMTFEQERRAVREFGFSRAQIDNYMWGSSFDILDPTRRRSLRAQHGLDFLLPEDWTDKPHRLAPLLNGAGAGDLRVALCAALLLIRPNLTVLKETREPGRKLVLGKPTTFLAHRVVTVKLSPDRLVRRIRAACKEERGRARARWHEVRGHYCHNHRAKVAPCVHDWREVAPNRWECGAGCGGLRYWREFPNGRGDASVGVVTKHYQVKP